MDKEELTAKKLEVRARLVAESTKSKKREKKRGFMTPERKKKLRLLLRKKAAEELKLQQEARANERRRAIGERCGKPIDLSSIEDNEDVGKQQEKLIEICQAYHKRIELLESDKYELERQLTRVDFDIHELAVKFNDMRGRYAKPSLRKVPKFGVKIGRMLALNAAKEPAITVNLRPVKRNNSLKWTRTLYLKSTYRTPGHDDDDDDEFGRKKILKKITPQSVFFLTFFLAALCLDNFLFFF